MFFLEWLKRVWAESSKIPIGVKIEVRVLVKIALILVSLFFIYTIEITSRSQTDEPRTNTTSCLDLLREAIAYSNRYGGTNSSNRCE
jgi:hypothetical protein